MIVYIFLVLLTFVLNQILCVGHCLFCFVVNLLTFRDVLHLSLNKKKAVVGSKSNLKLDETMYF